MTKKQRPFSTASFSPLPLLTSHLLFRQPQAGSFTQRVCQLAPLRPQHNSPLFSSVGRVHEKHGPHGKSTACGEKPQNTQKKHCMWDEKPQNTPNTPKSATRSTASVEKIWGKMGGETGEVWDFRSPTPRGRTESCTLRILTDALTSAHEKHCMWDEKPEGYAPEHNVLGNTPKKSTKMTASVGQQAHPYPSCRRVRRHPASPAPHLPAP